MLKITMISWKKWDIPYSIKISILIILLVKFAGVRAEIGGRIATNTTTFNRELLIVEKENDGKPFDLHTSYEDRANYYSNLRNPWLLLMLMLAAFAIVNRSVILGIVAVIFLIPVIIYQLQIMKNRHEAKMKEW